MTIRRAPVLATLGALATAALVAGCSASVVSGHGTARSASASGNPTGFPASSTVVTPSSPPTGSAGRLTAPDNDFSVVLPSGWTDATDKAASFGANAAYVAPAGGGFATNVNVVRQEIGSVDVTQYAQGTMQGVRSIGATSISATTPRTIDGEDALEYSFTDKQAGHVLRQRQTVVVHNDVGYVITYTALTTAYEASRADADTLIDSWQWS